MTHPSSTPTPRAAPGGIWRICAWLLALVLAAFGAVLLGGGIYLITLGGSWFYALAGAGLLATAVMLFRQRMGALKLYAVVWAATVAWALWEVGFDWWDQVPRLVAPSVVLILILIVTPALRRTEA